MTNERDIDPELESFYRRERASAPIPPAGARERVLLAVLDRIGPPDGGSGSPPPSGSPSGGSFGKLAASGAIGSVIGAAIAIGVQTWLAPAPPIASRETEIVYVDRPLPPSALEVPIDASPPIAIETDRPRRRAIDPPPVVEPIAQPDPGATSEERASIDRARSALRRGNAHEALVALMGHERRFPGGELAEERDRLIIESFVAQERYDLARARIDRYLREHPSGIHRAAIERIAATIPAP